MRTFGLYKPFITGTKKKEGLQETLKTTTKERMLLFRPNHKFIGLSIPHIHIPKIVYKAVV